MSESTLFENKLLSHDLPADTVVDGEVVALDESGRPDFHRLQHFTAEASRINYFVVACAKVVRQDSGRRSVTNALRSHCPMSRQSSVLSGDRLMRAGRKITRTARRTMPIRPTTFIRTICQNRTGRIDRRAQEIQRPTRNTKRTRKDVPETRPGATEATTKTRPGASAGGSRGRMTREDSRWNSGISNRRSKCSKNMSSSNREWSSVSRRLHIQMKRDRRTRDHKSHLGTQDVQWLSFPALNSALAARTSLVCGNDPMVVVRRRGNLRFCSCNFLRCGYGLARRVLCSPTLLVGL